MTKFIGRRVQIGIGEQFAAANPVSSEYGLKYSELGIQEMVTSIKDEDACGIIDQVHNSDVMERWMEGTLTGIVRTKSFGKVLKAHFGQVTSTGPTDSLYTHSYTRINNNNMTKYTIVELDPDRSVRYAGCQIGTLNLDWVVGDYVRYTANTIGKVSASCTETISYTTEDSFRPKDVTIKVAADAASLGAASAISVKEFHLSFEKELSRDHVLGSADVDTVLNTTFKVTGNMVINHEANDYLDWMKAPTKKALGMYCVNTDVLIGSASRPTLNVILSQVAFDTVEKGRTINEVQTLNVQFTAEYNLTNSRTVLVEYKNNVANYNVVATS